MEGGSKFGKKMNYMTVCKLIKFVESKGVRVINDLKNVKSGDVILVGSTGRLRPYPEDLDFLVIDTPLNLVKKFLEENFIIKKIIESGPQQLFVVIEKDRELNFWFTTKEQLPYSYFTYAYPKKLTIALRNKAKKMGYKLNQYGLYKNDKLIKVNNYLEIFDYLKVSRRTPIEQTIREVKYKHYSNTEIVLKKIRQKKEVEKWVDKYTKEC